MPHLAACMIVCHHASCGDAQGVAYGDKARTPELKSMTRRSSLEDVARSGVRSGVSSGVLSPLRDVSDGEPVFDPDEGDLVGRVHGALSPPPVDRTSQ
jgi:hypothetical protein